MADKHLPSEYQTFIHRSRYARWVPDQQRRETWEETVGRYISFFKGQLAKEHGLDKADPIWGVLNDAILELEVMPSMRALMTAGPALERDHIAGFNCSFMAMDNPRAFDEMVYILMCGSGVGFSAERQHVSKLPEVPEKLYETDTAITVRDSKLGWAKAVKQLVAMLYAGEIPKFDVSKVRLAGARLKTFGGRASGPEPLVDLFRFMIRIFKGAEGRKLTSLEVHDIACKIGEVVVSGGVRRSALISLSNLSDQRMREAKSGQWWETAPHRRLANNSVAYTERPEVGQWMHEWSSIYDSKSGERGIFNREAAAKQCAKYGRATELNGDDIAFGTNPCGEIILRSMQFCNLTEIVARASDTEETLFEKVRLATILGTMQSCLTDYRYIRKQWKDNSEAERLLGVSFTGIMDCPLLIGNDDREARNELLSRLRMVAEDTNRIWAEMLGIERSAAITCVKPSGTVSQLTDAASGIHARFGPQYVRRVRNDVKDPLTQFVIDAGVPNELDRFNPHNVVFSFPIQSPAESVSRDDRNAIEELEVWLDFKTNWCHHNPSVTINVRESEWPGVGAWVWDHFDEVAGISFLPHTDHVYEQAPYEDATPEQIGAMTQKMPDQIAWESHVENDDETTGTQELACVSGSCEI